MQQSGSLPTKGKKLIPNCLSSNGQPIWPPVNVRFSLSERTPRFYRSIRPLAALIDLPTLVPGEAINRRERCLLSKANPRVLRAAYQGIAKLNQQVRTHSHVMSPQSHSKLLEEIMSRKKEVHLFVLASLTIAALLVLNLHPTIGSSQIPIIRVADGGQPPPPPSPPKPFSLATTSPGTPAFVADGGQPPPPPSPTPRPPSDALSA